MGYALFIVLVFVFLGIDRLAHRNHPGADPGPRLTS